MNAATAATITRDAITLTNPARIGDEAFEVEARPATLADADTFLAFHSYARTGVWDLDSNGGVHAPVAKIDNRFNGTVAARLDQAVGTTHTPFEVRFARNVKDGDLISDMDLSETYVVAGSRLESGTMRIHMVGEGKTWNDRHTTDFPACTFVQVARRKA